MGIYMTERDQEALQEAVVSEYKPKYFSDSYLFSLISDFDTAMMGFIINSERIDTTANDFSDLLYDIKRRSLTNSLVKVVTSKNIVFCINNKPLTKAFKVFTAKDIKEKSNYVKTFIDVSGIITYNNGLWVCSDRNIGIVISYIIAAACQRIYYGKPTAFIQNPTIINEGIEIFSRLNNYVVDFMYKINTMPSQKQRLEYMSTMYYQLCILGKDADIQRARKIAIKQSEISDREADVIDIQTPKDAYVNINEFVQAIAKVLRLDKLTPEVYMNRWVNLYGPGTQFATELFPSFSTMITDAYVGSYINNQKTIEKITGRHMLSFAKEILDIETSVLNG